MASYHCAVKPISRSDGRSAVAAAAYRAGIELVDKRSGIVHDYTRKSGVLSSEIIAPSGARIADHSALWNAVEAAENRKDARTAREVIIALPDELTAGERRELATEYSEHLSDLFGVAIQLDLHAPDKQGDSRNWHAHLLMTTREVTLTADGPELGQKSILEKSDTDRRKLGHGSAASELARIRELWADMQNEALERANRPERVDHRSFKAQGIDRIPQIKMGQAANALERKGIATDKGDYNRNIAEQNALVVEIAELRAERDRQADFSAKFAVAVATEQPDFGFPEDLQDDLFAVQAAEERAEFEAAAKAAQEAERARLEAMAMIQAEQDRIAARAAFEAKVMAQMAAEREQTRLAAEAKQEAAAKAAVERERRINDLERISKRHMTAGLTVGTMGLKAIKDVGGDPENVDWVQLEQDIADRLTECEFEPVQILKALLEHSPARPAITPQELELALQGTQRLEALTPEPKQDKPEPPRFRPR